MSIYLTPPLPWADAERDDLSAWLGNMQDSSIQGYGLQEGYLATTGDLRLMGLTVTD